MNSRDIRKAFADYFKEKGHSFVGSSSLVPRNDPTLLFTNAGMVQFKSVFLGEEKRPYNRAVTCQKCMRAGGKHSDIENVGHTARHHTFFEMLGNFSFGDYFKKEAIGFAWELLTVRFGLPKDKLWVSVYEEDDEAARLWQDSVGLPESRIVRLGAKDNFWQMADTGPCGPCSEIIIDQGEGIGCGKPGCKAGCDCDRYLELWNLVFMQYNRDEHGNLNPLPNPSIDTGMGIERISAVLQRKNTNFDTDLFADIISSISTETGVPYGRSPESDASIRVIADHIRALSFLLAEGLMPSNEGRGYVLRRILRRAARHARLLGAGEPVLFKFLEPAAAYMRETYPELLEEMDRSLKVLKVEEERFIRTLEQGMRMLDDLLSSLRKKNVKVIPGDEAFKLYDTFGFPVDLLRDIALDGGYELDESGFHSAMAAQRERARASWVGEEAAVSSIYRELLSEAGKTEFVGYETLETESVVKAVLKDGRTVEEAAQGEDVEVLLDKTPFYGESGGQSGDTGIMLAEGVKLIIKDSVKPLEGVISHVVHVSKGPLRVWTKLRCEVDSDKRKSTMRNHTATHLLQAALRAFLGEHVKQAGSLVEPGRLRFDFTHFSSVSREEIDLVENFVNEKVVEDIKVDASEMDINDALKSGSTALFGEKYGERVRVISIGGVSKELCGGTHVSATGEIGPFVITSEGSVASGIRRIEALTGLAALRRFKEEEEELKNIGKMLKSDKPAERVAALIEENKELKRGLDKAKGAAAKDISRTLLERAETVEGVKLITARVDGLDMEGLRALADNVRDRLETGVLVIASEKDGQASIVSMVTGDLTSRFNAGDILKKVASACGGRGGGKANMAQGGTKQLDKLDDALNGVTDMFKK